MQLTLGAVKNVEGFTPWTNEFFKRILQAAMPVVVTNGRRVC